AVEISQYIVKKQLEKPRQSPMLLSVNIPALASHDPNNIRITSLGRRHPSQAVVPTISPNGETMYWIGSVGNVRDFADDTDFGAVQIGLVAITPLDLDLTHHDEIELAERWIHS